MALARALATAALLATAATVRANNCPKKPDLSHETRLLKDIFCDYDTDFRPVKDHNSAVEVKIRFAIQYATFDASEEAITVHSMLSLTWRDEYLNWRPEDYGNITNIQVPSHSIWSPGLALFNADVSVDTSERFWTTCLLSNDGRLQCVPLLSQTAICRTSLRRWPYDTQDCTLYFGSWMHSSEQVNFTFYKRDPLIFESFEDGPGWKLVGNSTGNLVYSVTNSTYGMLKYTLKFERVAAGLAAIVVVPSAVLVVLTLSTMLLEAALPRLALVCFVVYGHFLYLSQIGYELPKHSAETPLLLLFVRDSLFVSAAALAWTLALWGVRGRAGRPPRRLAAAAAALRRLPAAAAPLPLDHAPLTDATDEQQEHTLEWHHLANAFNNIVFYIVILVYIILFACYIPLGY